jgi:hypothetical protein
MISRGQMYRQLYNKAGIASLDAGAPSITYKGNIEPQMASAPDPMADLKDQYDDAIMKGVIPKTMSFEDFIALMREQAAYGGSMRQEYGLGSIVKSVGKAVGKVAGGIKDIVSSDLGKTALLAAGAYYGIPALAGKSWGQIGTSLMSKLPSFTMPKIGEMFTGKNLLTAGSILTGSALMTNLFGSPQKAAELYSQRPEAVNKYLDLYYRQTNPKREGQDDTSYEQEVADFVSRNTSEYRTADTFAYGGRAKYAMGDTAQMAAGIEGLPYRQNQAGIGEVDLRETGGFIPPVGIKEKADDIPAMLSNNEFVFTADAVRNAGGGDVNLGAQRMYDMMKKLENGGRV